MSEYQDKLKEMIDKSEDFKCLLVDRSHKMVRAKKMVDSQSLIAELTETLEEFVNNHGYCSYISDEEKEQEGSVIAARKLLAKARGEK